MRSPKRCPVQRDQRACGAGPLPSAMLLEHLRRLRKLVAHAVGIGAVDAAVVLLGRDGERQDLLFGQRIEGAAAEAEDARKHDCEFQFRMVLNYGSKAMRQTCAGATPAVREIASGIRLCPLVALVARGMSLDAPGTRRGVDAATACSARWKSRPSDPRARSVPPRRSFTPGARPARKGAWLYWWIRAPAGPIARPAAAGGRFMRMSPHRPHFVARRSC